MVKKRLLLPALIIISVTILVFITFQIVKDRPTLLLEEKILVLPEFNAVDINGNNIDSKKLKGINVYLQFVNSEDPYDLELVRDVHYQWKDELLKFVIFTENSKVFLENSGINNGITIIEEDYERFVSLFRSSRWAGSYYLFDISGKLVVSGRNQIGYEEGIKVFLKRLIHNQKFNMSELMGIGSNVNDVPWLHQISSYLQSRHNCSYLLVALFSLISDSACKSGPLLTFLSEIHSSEGDDVCVVSILSSDFNESDIGALRSQLNIDFPIVIADDLLTAKWDSLIEEYRKMDLTNLVFVVNESGEILKVNDNDCSNLDQFIAFTRSLCQSD